MYSVKFAKSNGQRLQKFLKTLLALSMFYQFFPVWLEDKIAHKCDQLLISKHVIHHYLYPKFLSYLAKYYYLYNTRMSFKKKSLLPKYWRLLNFNYLSLNYYKIAYTSGTFSWRNAAYLKLIHSSLLSSNTNQNLKFTDPLQTIPIRYFRNEW